MSAVVADTHAAIWMLTMPARLSSAALSALKGAEAAAAPIYLASISLVETAYLIEKGRLPESLFDRLQRELANPDSGLTLVPLDLPIAQALRRISRAAVPEMPDRIIAATALHLGLPLVTRDLNIAASGIPTLW